MLIIGAWYIAAISGLFHLGSSGRGVTLTTCLYVSPILRMTGVIRLLPLYPFMLYATFAFHSCLGLQFAVFLRFSVAL